MYISLTDTQLNNLRIFLDRVNLVGHEVPAFVSILEAINNPLPAPKGPDKEEDPK